MAIRYVDKEAEVPAAKAASRKAEPPADTARDRPQGDSAAETLPFAKSEPKPRGRKKPLK